MSKNDDESNDLAQQVLKIQEACAELGWDIAMDDSSEVVMGLVIGTSQYVNETLANMLNGELYEIWGKPGSNKNKLH